MTLRRGSDVAILSKILINSNDKKETMSKKLIESKITINAPIEKVWGILADFDNYNKWNPFTPKIELQQQIGSDVILHLRLNPKSTKKRIQKVQLLAWEEGTGMEWGIQNTWYLKTVRIQKLTVIDEHSTEYYTSEAFSGLLTGLVLALYRKKIQIGFDEVAQGLKKEAEKA